MMSKSYPFVIETGCFFHILSAFLSECHKKQVFNYQNVLINSFLTFFCCQKVFNYQNVIIILSECHYILANCHRKNYQKVLIRLSKCHQMLAKRHNEKSVFWLNHRENRHFQKWTSIYKYNISIYYLIIL